jgi:hypothetical protein
MMISPKSHSEALAKDGSAAWYPSPGYGIPNQPKNYFSSNSFLTFVVK